VSPLLLLLAILLMQAPPATGNISGVVLKSGTVLQQSLPNARVELTGGPATPRTVRTETNGGFVFSNLLPGTYRLLVTKDGFIRSDRKVVLSRGQQMPAIVFHLEPAPTVTGRVQDEYGEPIADVLVQALRRTYDIRGNPTLTSVASSLTDDRGQYRIYWVDPGDMRTQMQQEAFPGDDISDRAMPEESAPGFMALVEGNLPSGRYRAHALRREEAAL